LCYGYKSKTAVDTNPITINYAVAYTERCFPLVSQINVTYVYDIVITDTKLTQFTCGSFQGSAFQTVYFVVCGY